MHKPHTTKTWHQKHKENLTLGQRAADTIRNVMGSWRFVFIFILVMFGWGLYNLTTRIPFDPYPFILLNLALSTLAGLQGAILLIAAKRADEVSATLAENDYATNLAAKKEIEEVQHSQKKILRTLDEIVERLPQNNRRK